ncbi:MAG: hypothetical protein ACOYOK_10825, partial [Pseudobdellovibrionaceae bacterium]
IDFQNETDKLSQIWKKSLIDILNTKAGLLFFTSLDCSPIAAVRDLGAPTSDAINFFEKCRKNFEQHFSTQPDGSSIGGKIWPRQVYFVLTEDNNFMLDSWTTDQNETFFFIHPKTTELSFTLSMIHEFAISFDGKYNFNLMKYLIYEEMIKADRNKQRALTLIMVDPKSTNDKDDFELRLKMSMDPIIALGFAVLRAEYFEDKFLYDKKIISKVDLDRKYSKNCYERLENLSQQLFNISTWIDYNNSRKNKLTAILENYSIDGGTISKKVDKIQTDNFIQFMKKNPFSVKSQNQEFEFCQYMSIPFLMPFTYSFGAEGPRPRTTGGYEGD